MAMGNKESREENSLKEKMGRNIPQLRVYTGAQIEKTQEMFSTSETNICSSI